MSTMQESYTPHLIDNEASKPQNDTLITGDEYEKMS
jgi:hypothetical protein